MNLLTAQRKTLTSGLRSAEKLVLLALLDHWSETSQEVFPSAARLCALTSLGRSTVLRTLAALEAAGVIVPVRHVAGGPKVWRFDLDALADRCQSDTGIRATPVSERHHPGVRAGRGGVTVTRGVVSERDGVVSQRHPKEPMKEPMEGTHEGTHGSDPGARGAPEEPAPSELERTRRPRLWRFVPDDWRPNDAHRAKAEELGLDLDAQADAFRNHEFAQPKSDADRAFHAWLRNSATRFGRHPPRFSAPRAPVLPVDLFERARRLRELERSEI